jgi:hypothetical protein
MKYRKISYHIKPGGEHTKVDHGEVEETTPLTEAVEAEATKHPPGTLIFGASRNDVVEFVGPLELD